MTKQKNGPKMIFFNKTLFQKHLDDFSQKKKTLKSKIDTFLITEFRTYVDLKGDGMNLTVG